MKSVVIVGANRGIGLEFCKQYKNLGCEVYGLCREASDELKELGVNIIEGIDVSNDKVIEQIKKKWTNKNIDILIHNAGILLSDTYDTSSSESMLKQFEINALGPFRIVKAFKKHLSEGSKVGFLSSRVGSVADNSSSNNYGYRMSKAALNMLGTNFAIDLKPAGIAVALLHPGYVKTEMTKFNGFIEASEAASGLIQRMEELNIESTGGFWHSNGESLPW